PRARTLADWYRLLACGLRLPLAGASGKDRNTMALGGVRIYARLEPDQEFSYGAWVEAVRAGRTFVTAGPLLSLTVDGHGPGSVLSLSEGGQTVRVRAEARGAAAFDRLEVLHNGDVLAAREPDGDRRSATVELEWPAADSGWLAARCRGGENGSLVRAH